MHKHFSVNLAGRDFVVGDVHGCFGLLQDHLDRIGFDFAVDRLFSVGDLVDRGEESEAVHEWLAKSWFHPVRGNHEQMAIDYVANMLDPCEYAANGGAWFLELTHSERARIADLFATLPIAIDVDTPNGLVGIVHADCPSDSWPQLRRALAGKNGDAFAQLCIWSRERLQVKDTTLVDGVNIIIVGHTPVEESTLLGNIQYIDTGAVFGYDLTIVQIN